MIYLDLTVFFIWLVLEQVQLPPVVAMPAHVMADVKPVVPVANRVATPVENSCF